MIVELLVGVSYVPKGTVEYPGLYTFKVTDTVRGLLVALAAEMVMVPLYTPAERPKVLTDTLNTPPLVPESGITFIQFLSTVADQLRVLPVELLIEKVWAPVVFPPWTAPKVNWVRSKTIDVSRIYSTLSNQPQSSVP